MVPKMSREWVRLTQPPDTTLASGDYLNRLLPSWITLQNTLLLIVALLSSILFARRIYSWFTSASTRPARINQPTNFLEELGQVPAYPPIWSMDEKRVRPKGAADSPKGHRVNFAQDEPVHKRVLTIEPGWGGRDDSLPRSIMARPPLAPPLTPPELSNTIFTFDDRRRSTESFIHQPNPDYSSASTTTSASQSHSASPPTPRRRSYNKTLPIGIPVPLSSTDSDPADLTFSPSSYPPTSPLLPPAPPGYVGTSESVSKTGRGIDVRGEIVSVVDDDGAGWTRHTRVYGGGVCLACAASGGDHGGGFYGATVRPEEMR
jgi:hypothetical protein